MTRLNFTQYAIKLCETVSIRSTCLHRHQGAIIVRGKHLLSTGYNGSPPGAPHCDELGYCAKEKGMDCRATGLHGEINAIISAAKNGIAVKDSDMYCLYSPCLTCCNMIATAGIHFVYYQHVYDGYPEGPGYLASIGIPCFLADAEGQVWLHASTK